MGLRVEIINPTSPKFLCVGVLYHSNRCSMLPRMTEDNFTVFLANPSRLSPRGERHQTNSGREIGEVRGKAGWLAAHRVGFGEALLCGLSDSCSTLWDICGGCLICN